MEEIFEEHPEETTVERAEKARVGWKEWLNSEAAIRWVYLFFGFCVIVLVMVLLQFSTPAICCGDWDGYYHIRWSSILWESFRDLKGLPRFEWLPLTVLNPEAYADHHFLFHLLQIPFLWFFEPVTAAKVAAVFYGTLAIFSAYWLMFRYKIDYLLVWFFALLGCASSFLFRINMAKAPPLTIIYTIIGIYLLFERKYFWLLPLMFLFVWTYSLFPLLFIAAFIWTLIIAWNEHRFEWKPLVYTIGGMVLGNIINPYFPQNFWLFWEHFYTKLAAVGDFDVPVGGEWYPYSGMDLLTHLPIALTAMLIGYILFMPRNGKLPEKATFFLLFVSMLLIGQFTSKRYAEYFPPFAILFAAFSWQAFRVTTRKEALPDDLRLELEPFLDVEQTDEKQELYGTLKQVAAILVGVVLAAWVAFNLYGVKIGKFEQVGLIQQLRGNEANERYSKAMSWANENIPEGERIFNSNWDDFPKMFFYDQKHSYVYGLDPNYLYTKNPELYKLVTEITGGKIEDPAPVLREKFGVNYVFTDVRENVDMVANLLESGWGEMAYEDSEAIFIRIREQKGESALDAVEDETDLTPEEIQQLEEEEEAANANGGGKADDEEN